MTKAGDVNDLSRGMNEELNEFYRDNTENIYKDFVTRVAAVCDLIIITTTGSVDQEFYIT